MFGATLILLTIFDCLLVFMVILKENNKSCFWDCPLDKGKDYNGPSLCIGNFNMILSQSKKYGGRFYSCSSNDLFHSFLDSFGMVDLGFFGNLFTWSNKRQDHHIIKEHLDCGIANSQ